MTYKLGSLFDGSGGFPLAGSLCGIEPVWAAEVEPYPIAVTRSRFPSMKHLGDISKINGGEIEPVDIITFGSPCQDLSVAGKRAGLKHEANGDEETTRSGLFMEAVRIIKEMREKTNGRYPTFALWENVPGAFSSNKGEDFRIVCEDLIKIVEPSASMPPVPKNGWAYADSYCGNGWSLAYRVFDAQYWGVPQRRRRIHLVLDLRGERAREVLFEREGVRGYFAEGRTPWQAAPGNAQSGIGADDRAGECVGFLRQLSGVEAVEELSPTLLAAAGESGNNKPCVAYSFDSLASNSMKSSNPHSGCRQVEVAKTLDTTDPNHSKNQGGIAIVEPVKCYDIGEARLRTPSEYEEVSPTITARCGTGGNNVPAVVEQRLMDAYQHHGWRENTVCGTLTAGQNDTVRGDTPLVCGKYLFENHSQDTRYKGPLDVCPMLPAQLGTGGNNTPFVVEPACYWDGGQIAGTLTANNAGGNQRMPDKENFNCVMVMEPISSDGDVAGTLDASYYKGTGTRMGRERTFIAFCIGNGQENEACRPEKEISKTLNCVVDPMKVLIKEPTRYIVRRLTPTECARLQGFADRWGDIDGKDVFTPDEFQFWREVRQTHDAINGKKRQEYTEKQILVWYNKLHTDSAEYKMWGNGIALPPALYCLQGITDALKEYGNEPVVEKKFDMEKAIEEVDHSSVMLAYARIWKNRKHLTRQQMKTLKGQIKAGDADAAMRGLDKLLKEGKA